jgi:tRNA(adenine34) deaminase
VEKPFLKKPSKVAELAVHESWMRLALQQARLGYEHNEVPIGAVVVHKNQVIGQGYNHREKSFHITGHAEIMAIQQASEKLKSWRLNECTLYVTVEPCLMCIGAIVQSRLQAVVVGTHEHKTGAIESTISIRKIPNLSHHPKIYFGVLESACRQLMTDFFAQTRHEKK